MINSYSNQLTLGPQLGSHQTSERTLESLNGPTFFMEWLIHLLVVEALIFKKFCLLLHMKFCVT